MKFCINIMPLGTTSFSYLPAITNTSMAALQMWV